jgi:hypothetical protein
VASAAVSVQCLVSQLTLKRCFPQTLSLNHVLPYLCVRGASL